MLKKSGSNFGYESITDRAASQGGANGEVDRVVSHKGRPQHPLQALGLALTQLFHPLRNSIGTEILCIEEDCDQAGLPLTVRQELS